MSFQKFVGHPSHVLTINLMSLFFLCPISLDLHVLISRLILSFFSVFKSNVAGSGELIVNDVVDFSPFGLYRSNFFVLFPQSPHM